MPLLKNGSIGTDTWVKLSDDDAIPEQGCVIVSLSRWLSDKNLRNEETLKVGVHLAGDQSPAQVVDDLNQIDLFALEFSLFSDGRAFSSARLLRERYGFEGEIRATGNVLCDQYGFMLRCGFDAFEISEDEDLVIWERQATSMQYVYQHASDDAAAVWRKRHGQTRAAS